jgi:hypothetical protein
MAMRHISVDAVVGPLLAAFAASVYGWADQPDLAFEQLAMLVRIQSVPQLQRPQDQSQLASNSQQTPRFGKLLAELASPGLKGRLASPHPFYTRLTTEDILLRALTCQPGLKPAES